MAVTKKRKTTRRAPRPLSESQFTLVLEELRGEFKVLGEALQSFREQMNRRFDALDKRFDALDKRFDALDKRFDSIDGRVGWVGGQVRL
jgi:acyl carrier protein phosphodiesterase